MSDENVVAALKARVEHLLERERFFAEKLGVPNLGVNRQDWGEAISKHDAKVAWDALGMVYQSNKSDRSFALDDITPEEVALCRVIEAISAALGNANPTVDIAMDIGAPGVKHLRVLRREVVASIPCSGLPATRPRELRILLDQMRFLAGQVYSNRASDKAALLTQTPKKVAEIEEKMQAISQALSLHDGLVPVAHQSHNDRNNDGW